MFRSRRLLGQTQTTDSEREDSERDSARLRTTLADLMGGRTETFYEPTVRAAKNAESPEAKPSSNGKTGVTEAPAMQLIAEHRKALEALLTEVRTLEDRIANESQASQAVEQCAAARQKVEAAAALEQQAVQTAKDAEERHRLLESELQAAEDRVTRAQAEVEAARGKEATAQHEAQEAAANVAECEAARVAAENDAKAAEERAEALKGKLSLQDGQFAGMDDVKALSQRIVEQVTALAAE